MNYISLKKFFSILLCIFMCIGVVQAQNAKRSAKASVTEVRSTVVDENGTPVPDATVLSREGSITTYTAVDGTFSIKTKENDVIFIEAPGYKDYILNLRIGRAPSKVVMKKEEPLKGRGDMIERPDGGITSRHDMTAAITTVNTERLSSYPDFNFSAALQGQAAGLIVRCTNGGLGNNSANYFVRGQHGGSSQAIVVIDGIERAIDDILPEEVGSVQVLKDASAKVLYGPRAANGVIFITTKRGEAYKRIIRTSLEYGVSVSTRVPEFLGSYEYAQLYNEALAGDGYAPMYSAIQLDGYKNSTGENDLLFPDVNWYKRFTSDTQTFRKAVAEFIGGNESVRYSVITGYTGGTGLEKVGIGTQMNRFNVRGNLDIQINDFLVAVADVGARLEKMRWGGVNQANLYTRMSTLRPNEYPLIISPESLSMEPNADGTPFFGASSTIAKNLLDDVEYGGDSSEQYVISQSTVGLKFDMDKYVKGLTANAFVTFDNYSLLTQGITKRHDTYSVDSYLDESGNPAYRISQQQKVKLDDNITINSHTTKRTMGMRGDVGYKREFGKNAFSAIAAYRYFWDQSLGATQNCATSNSTLRLNYSFDNRYMVEGTLGLMGSNQFAKNHRFLFTPTVSAAWILSNEGFLSGSTAINFLKLKASAGRLGYDPNSNYMLYRTQWSYSADYNVGATNGAKEYVISLARLGNEDINWITSTECNIGIEGVAVDNHLSFEFNYFNDLRAGNFAKPSSLYSAAIGDYTMTRGFNRFANQGIDLALGWKGSASGGDFHYDARLNLTVSRDKVLQTNELDNIEDYRKSVGCPSSAIIDLQAEGLFGKDVPLAGHALQTFGAYGVGDVAYVDKNNDGIVDASDQCYLGQNFPLTSWGLNINLKYKDFALYVHGVAETGASAMLSNSYWWNVGTGAYSVKARDRYNPTLNPGGTLPRLTTTSGGNSYRSSSFWLEDASFFRLKAVELSYNFTNRNVGIFKQLKVFARGTNLLVLSKIKDLDPEMPAAGVTNYPYYSTVTGGVTVSF
ncbi:MAG: SusC/RagA family TonB-linked outer membrane protein [Bacteroidales bacterium]|nr:SusC/RagA family TonB-linked outer membrane protein [Bacteroidales bacterium]